MIELTLTPNDAKILLEMLQEACAERQKMAKYALENAADEVFKQWAILSEATARRLLANVNAQIALQKK